MTDERKNEIYAILLIAAGTLLLLSLATFDPMDLPAYTSSPNEPVHNMAGFLGAHVAGGLFFVFTVNTLEQLKIAEELGCDGVISDCPGDLDL